MHQETILVLDFGGQYNQLIARRVRDLNVYCEVLPYYASIETIREKKPKGIIFTGGPASINAPDAPKCDKTIFELGIPILGICYGSQLISYCFGGKVAKANQREYGKSRIRYNTSNELFHGLESDSICWMSHTDYIEKSPEGFDIIASTDSCPVAAIANTAKKIYGVQFHPEVVHTSCGTEILKNFLLGYVDAQGIGIWQILLKSQFNGLGKSKATKRFFVHCQGEWIVPLLQY